VGVATGLAWTESGGDIIYVEASVVKGKGQLTLTGHLGDVMKESAQAALSYVRSRDKELGIKPDTFAKHDLHIHVPAGAIPKDGPSAGITMATAIASALTNTPIAKEVAMTGEVTLRGRVLPIGGLKEKLLAAKRAGITTVVLPKRNYKDLAEVPKHVRRGLQLVFAETMDEVLGAALKRPQTRSQIRSQARPQTRSQARVQARPQSNVRPKHNSKPKPRHHPLPAARATAKPSVKAVQ
jgi:ATP-dependent Lon protease